MSPEDQGLGHRWPDYPPCGYRTSLNIRKCIEAVFSWAKTIGGLRKTKLRGVPKVKAQTVFTCAAYNLTRMGWLFGWRWSTAKAVVRP